MINTYCNCVCHSPDRNIKHIIACCQGQCEGCNRYLKSPLNEHRVVCPLWYKWSCKQKRKYLKQNELYDLFVRAKQINK